uniref:transcription termination factor MTEF18, mitochondrial-like n=1 Tax=Erigeron canadensis TaxID=72917 RepID=UPI001CB8E249|nr:transcription termination factor MTEF18, mitochondrial-like [Erigeron canadensis]XP_043637127.1 transcription termination factor MTEF18, mitochondrial-like [Erigeron canadensis]
MFLNFTFINIYIKLLPLFMYHIKIFKKSYLLRWALVDLYKNPFFSSGSYFVSQNPRFFSTKSAYKPKNSQKVNDLFPVNDGNESLWSRVEFREAQDALLDYLHSTRSLQFMDAENISRNSPRFLEKLLKGVEGSENVGQSVRRFLRYHPINEFEPFFESMGLEACELSTLLPRKLMFLSDDNVLLENYHVLCQYGFAPNKIGKIYKDVKEVFRYRNGVLLSRLKELQGTVLDQSTVVKLVGSCPSILIGDRIRDVFKVVTELKIVGVVNSWFVEHLSEDESYDWKHMLELLCIFNKLGCEKEHLGRMIHEHPTILLHDSGITATSIIGFLLKFGATKNDIVSSFLKLPEIKIHEYDSNLRRSYHFLSEIEMDVDNIANLFRAHPHLLGSCYLKGVKTALNSLNCGKKRLCEIIKDSPQEIKSLALGLRVTPLPSSKNCTLEKTKFLLELGFTENSSEMKRALKRFRGRAEELQERFDCLAKFGFDKKEVVEMLKSAPQVVNQTKEVLEMKVDFLVNHLGYPLSSISGYPSSLSYAIEKVKLRCTFYKWLKEQGATNGMAISTILACSEKQFIREKVKRHPKGIEVYQMLKKKIYLES